VSPTDTDVTLTAEPAGKTTVKVTARHGGTVLYVDTLNPAAAAARKKFADAVVAKYPGSECCSTQGASWSPGGRRTSAGRTAGGR
jgi:hypothetical protein